MAWHEIPRGEWGEFLRGFSSQHRDWQVTVEVIEDGGPPRVPFLLQPLREIRLEDDALVVELAGDSLEDTRIAGPERILLDQTCEDAERADRALAIEGRDAALRLQFRVVIPAELVDGATD